MSEQAELPIGGGVTNCLRCRKLCKRGTPDPKARAIQHSATDGFCPNCMTQKFLLSIEGMERVIDRHGGPEIFLDVEWRNRVLRPQMQAVLAHTQMRENEINWMEVCMNWYDPWPPGRGPQPGANY